MTTPARYLGYLSNARYHKAAFNRLLVQFPRDACIDDVQIGTPVLPCMALFSMEDELLNLLYPLQG
jgi:hypothetical protein